MSNADTSRSGKRTPPSAGTRTRIRKTASLSETRLTGVRRIPRSLGGAALGFFGVVAFFAQLGGLFGMSTGHFLGMLVLAVVVLGFGIWAVDRTGLRPTFPQRWKPRRRIEPLDASAWEELAASLGAKMRVRGLPRIVGGYRGVAIRIEFLRLGGARTLAVAVLRKPVGARLEVRPRRARLHTPLDRETGDPGFDAEYRVACKLAEPAARLLSREAREWVRAVEPEVVVARGRKVEAHRDGFVSDPDRLRGLLETVTEMARA